MAGPWCPSVTRSELWDRKFSNPEHMSRDNLIKELNEIRIEWCRLRVRLKDAERHMGLLTRLVRHFRPRLFPWELPE